MVETQIISVLRRPAFALAAVSIATAFSLVFLYFDEFYFVSPYPVFFVDPGRLPVFLLDVAISALSGVVLILSAYEIRTFPRLRGSYRRTGLMGVAAAFIAGACPCYYLVPLLAIAGGAGGILASLGVLFYDYQIPIKLGSLALLIFTAFTQERSLRAACELPGQADAPSSIAPEPPQTRQ